LHLINRLSERITDDYSWLQDFHRSIVLATTVELAAEDRLWVALRELNSLGLVAMREYPGRNSDNFATPGADTFVAEVRRRHATSGS